MPFFDAGTYFVGPKPPSSVVDAGPIATMIRRESVATLLALCATAAGRAGNPAPSYKPTTSPIPSPRCRPGPRRPTPRRRLFRRRGWSADARVYRRGAVNVNDAWARPASPHTADPVVPSLSTEDIGRSPDLHAYERAEQQGPDVHPRPPTAAHDDGKL